MMIRFTTTKRALSIFVFAVAITVSANANPIEISNWNQLNNIKTNLSADYVLVNDLDENTEGFATYQSGAGFEPIGDSTTPFTGSLDGQGFKISGLFINRVDGFSGLFGLLIQT